MQNFGRKFQTFGQKLVTQCNVKAAVNFTCLTKLRFYARVHIKQVICNIWRRKIRVIGRQLVFILIGKHFWQYSWTTFDQSSGLKWHQLCVQPQHRHQRCHRSRRGRRVTWRHCVSTRLADRTVPVTLRRPSQTLTLPGSAIYTHTHAHAHTHTHTQIHADKHTHIDFTNS